MWTRTIRQWTLSIAIALAALIVISLMFDGGAMATSATGASFPYPGCGISLQDCIDNVAAPGDSIMIQPGVYTESVVLNKAVNLMGIDPAVTILKAANGFRVLVIDAAPISSSIVISGLRFTGGNASSQACSCGGGILITSTSGVLLKNIDIDFNQAQSGGGLAVQDSQAFLEDAQIVSNTANYGGGVYMVNSTVQMNGGHVDGNIATTASGGVHLGSGQFTLNGGSIGQNNSSGPAGGVMVVSGSFTQTGGLIMNNSAGDGGGLFNQSASVVLSGGQITNNIASNYGGGVFNSQGGLKLSGGQVLSNAAQSGGGVYLEQALATMNLSSGYIAANRADFGGGLFLNSGSATLVNAQIASNVANISGGGVYVALPGSAFYQNNGGIQNNQASDGAGVFVQAGFFEQISGAIANNQAGNWGGGLLVADAGGSALLNGGSIMSNTASVLGGGVFLDQGRAMLAASAIVSNSTPGDGGGVYLLQPTATFTQTGGLISHNWANNGGGLAVAQGRAELVNAQIVSNTAVVDGGGAFLTSVDATVNLWAGSISRNAAQYGGGAKVYSGTFKLIDGQLMSNTASFDGGGLYVYPGAAFIQINGALQGNFANGNGGGAYFSDPISLKNISITNNTAQVAGGGLYAAAPITLVTSLVQQNLAVDGGALKAVSPTMISGTQFLTNTASGSGGAVFADATATLIGDSVSNNHASVSGGGLAGNSFDVTNTQFVNNSVDGDGGAIHANNAVWLSNALFLQNSTLTGNGGAVWANNVSAADTRFISNTANSGGGLYVNDNATLQRIRLDSNAAVQGGGLYANTASAADQFSVTSSKVIANQADVGGGVYQAGFGGGTIVNSVFARNQASTEADALSLNSAGEVDVYFATLANPITPTGEAIVVNNGTVNLTNTIVASYSIGLKRNSGSISEDYNLYFANSVSQTGILVQGSHSLNNLDPRFVKPGADDYHLQLFSPAVDAATNLGIYTDIGGWPRPMGGGFDIGAFELQAQSTNVGPTTGGQLNYVDNRGVTTTVFLPAGLVSNSTTIIFNNLNSESITSTPPSGLSFVGNLFDLDAFAGLSQIHDITFTLPVTIIIHYSDDQLAGIDERTMRLYRLEPLLNQWRPIGYRLGEHQMLNATNNTLTVVVLGFSRFGRAGVSAEHDIFLPLVMKGN
jgi:predicted outer membrane repeat protein